MRACIAVCLWFFFCVCRCYCIPATTTTTMYRSHKSVQDEKRERLVPRFGLCGTKHTHVFTCISNKSHNTSTGGSDNGDGKALGPFYVLESKSAANAWEWNNNNNKCQKLRTTTKETKTRKKLHIHKKNQHCIVARALNIYTRHSVDVRRIQHGTQCITPTSSVFLWFSSFTTLSCVLHNVKTLFWFWREVKTTRNYNTFSTLKEFVQAIFGI